MKNLLIIDYQNDFITGSLAVQNSLQVVENMKNFDLSVFDKIGLTLDMHPSDHCSFEVNGGCWPIHCVRDTDGADIQVDLQNKLETEFDKKKIVRFEKGTERETEEYSFLQNEICRNSFTKLFDRKDELYIAGIAGDYCVYETVIDLLKLGYTRLVLLKNMIVSIDGGTKLDELIEAKHLECVE